MRETGKAVRQASRPRRAASTWSGFSRPPCLAGTSPSPPRLGGPGDCLERVLWDPRPRVAGRGRPSTSVSRKLGPSEPSRTQPRPAQAAASWATWCWVVHGGDRGPVPASPPRRVRRLAPAEPLATFFPSAPSPPRVRDLGTEELHLCRPKHPALPSEGPWRHRAACGGGPTSSGLFLVVFLKRPQNRMPHKPHGLPFQRGR